MSISERFQSTPIMTETEPQALEDQESRQEIMTSRKAQLERERLRLLSPTASPDGDDFDKVGEALIKSVKSFEAMFGPPFSSEKSEVCLQVDPVASGGGHSHSGDDT